MSIGLRHRAVPTDTAQLPSSWTSLLRAALAVFGALHVVAAIAFTDLEAAGLALLLGVVVALRRRLPRTTTVALAILFVNMAAWVLPGTIRNLAGAAAAPVVLLQAALGLTAVVGLAALVGERRPASGTVAIRVVPAAAAVALLVVGLVAVTTSGPVGPRPGDLEVVASGTAFLPESLETSAGPVAVHLANEDFFWHTFSVPALGVHLWVPVDGSGRVTFDAPAGTWEYTCEVPGHGTVMRGELVVAP